MPMQLPLLLLLPFWCSMCHNVSTTIAVAGSLVLVILFFVIALTAACRWCSHCSCCHHHPLLLAVPWYYQLLFAAITIVSAACRLLLCCYVVAALFQYAVVVVACVATTAWLSLPHSLPTCSQTCFATAVSAVYTFFCSMDHDLSGSLLQPPPVDCCFFF